VSSDLLLNPTRFSSATCWHVHVSSPLLPQSHMTLFKHLTACCTCYTQPVPLQADISSQLLISVVTSLARSNKDTKTHTHTHTVRHVLHVSLQQHYFIRQLSLVTLHRIA
jgi:hypothetical protein